MFSSFPSSREQSMYGTPSLRILRIQRPKIVLDPSYSIVFDTLSYQFYPDFYIIAYFCYYYYFFILTVGVISIDFTNSIDCRCRCCRVLCVTVHGFRFKQRLRSCGFGLHRGRHLSQFHRRCVQSFGHSL